MRFKRTLTAAGALAIAAAIGVTAGCSNQLNDQKDVGQTHADYIMTYLNVADFPNVTLLCIKGAGFATTTRDNLAAIQRVPEWDAFCATKIPATQP
jgi:hypothetical protein